MKDKSENQKLVDIMFEIAFIVRENEELRDLGNEEFAEWVASQLRESGFSTVPCGMSWGVLTQ